MAGNKNVASGSKLSSFCMFLAFAVHSPGMIYLYVMMWCKELFPLNLNCKTNFVVNIFHLSENLTECTSNPPKMHRVPVTVAKNIGP